MIHMDRPGKSLLYLQDNKDRKYTTIIRSQAFKDLEEVRPGRRKLKCKGPEVGMSLAWRGSREVSAARV